MPNITGSFYPWSGINSIDMGVVSGLTTGAFTRIEGTQQTVIQTTSSASNGTGAINFNASLSSSTYQDGAKVNPDHVYVNFIIKY